MGNESEIVSLLSTIVFLYCTIQWLKIQWYDHKTRTRRNTDYIILSAPSKGRLVKQIRRYQKRGYDLYGKIEQSDDGTVYEHSMVISN